MKKLNYSYIWGLFVSFMMVSVPLYSQLKSTTNGNNGTTLTSTIDMCPQWELEYQWTIEKSVNPSLWNLFNGDSGTSQYTIAVLKDNGTSNGYFTGKVCITNGGEVATENLAVELELQNGYGPPNDFLTSATMDLSEKPVLAPGETHCYNYKINIPNIGGPYPQPHAGATYKITAHITITNHSGSLGSATGPDPSASGNFLNEPTVKHGAVNVKDTNGSEWDFNDSGTVSYTKTFACSTDAGENTNTATIFFKDDGTQGPSDDALVTVNCYDISVAKTAATSYTKTYNWNIDKVANKASLLLSIGQTYMVNYTVTVAASVTDSDWSTSGEITVNNPAPIPATINSITDVVSPSIAATTSFAVTFPYDIPANSGLIGAYTVDLPDATARTNTATAILQNHSYDKDLVATPSGTNEYTGTASIDFTTASITHVDEYIDVTDSQMGALGTVCFGDAPKTFTYSFLIGPYEECGDYSVNNVADFVTNDTGTTGSDSWTININLPCLSGCTLTPGYWKTHSSFGPAPYDDTWELLSAAGANTTFLLSGQTYYQVLWTPPSGGNVYYILAHAYIAAKLNMLNGADATSIQSAFDKATALFYVKTPAQTATFKPKDKTQWITLATILDNYNNGLIGPGHCSEDETPVKSAQLATEPNMPTNAVGLINYPNPFANATTFAFTLPAKTNVTLAVYNLSGQRIATVYSGALSEGLHTFEWSAPSTVGKGVYIYKLESTNLNEVSVLIIK